MSVTMNGNTFATWEDVRKEMFTPEEIAESNLRVALIGELVKARTERGLSQKQLEELSGGQAAGYRPHGERQHHSEP